MRIFFCKLDSKSKSEHCRTDRHHQPFAKETCGASKNHRQAEAKVGSSEITASTWQKQKSPDEYHTGIGEQKSKLSNHSGATLTLMRSVCTLAAYKTGSSNRPDVSGQMISRWTHKCACALDAHDLEWHREHRAALMDPAANRLGRQWEIYAPRSDGTNKKLIHKTHLQVTCIIPSNP